MASFLDFVKNKAKEYANDFSVGMDIARNPNQSIPTRTAQGYLQGITQAGGQALNLGTKISQKINPFMPKQPNPFVNKIDTYSKNIAPTTTAGKIGSFVGQNLPAFALPASKGFTAEKIASPVARLAANSLLRGGENAALGAAQRIATNQKVTPKNVIGDIGTGAIANTVMSPLEIIGRPGFLGNGRQGAIGETTSYLTNNYKDIQANHNMTKPYYDIADELRLTDNYHSFKNIIANSKWGKGRKPAEVDRIAQDMWRSGRNNAEMAQKLWNLDNYNTSYKNVKINDYRKMSPGFAKFPQKGDLIEPKTTVPQSEATSPLSKPQETKIQTSRQSRPGQPTEVLPNHQQVSSFGSNITPEQQIINNVNGTLRGGQVRERGFVTSVKEGSKTPQPVKDMVNGTYVVKSDAERISHARQLIKSDPKAAEQMALNPRNDTDITIGNQLLDHYLSTGKFDEAKVLTDKMAESGTELGRAVHAFADYDKTTPSGAVKFAQKTINEFNRTNPNKKLSLKGADIKNLMDRAHSIQQMAQGRERNIASKQLMDEVNNLIPSSIADKAITVWKAGLLTSLRTTERNLLGNTIHGVAEVAKDPFAVLNDSLLSLKTGKREVTATTKGLITGGKKGVQAAKDIYTLGYDPEQAIEKFDVKHITWGDNPVEQGLKKYTDLVFRNMGAQDKPFYHSAFARSLYDQAGAEAINAGLKGDRAFIESLVSNPTERMKLNATKDAQVAVFQNKNAASNIASAIKNELKKDPTGVLSAAGEIVAPFTGVPSSIAGQMVAYSPVGLIKGIANDYKVLAGKITPELLPDLQRQASQEIGRGVIGTGIVALGVYLTKRGLMTGQPKDANEAKQWELEGKQANSVLVNGKWRSINSVGPEALVMLAGSKLAEGNDTGTAVANIGKDFTSQTFLSGVQQPLNAISDPARYAGTYVPNQAASVIPNIVKDMAKSGDKTQRETYVPKNIKQSTINSLKAGIPGERNTLLPKRDVLGNPLPNEQSGVGAFVDLFNSKTPVKNDVVNELSRLNMVDQSATPSKLSPDQTIYGQKVKLTPEELDKLETESGGQVQSIIDAVIKERGYEDLPDSEKKKMLDSAVSDVRDQAKQNLASGIQGFDANSITDKYKLQIQKDQFSNEKGNFKDLGNGIVLRKNSSGDVTPMTKIDYETKLTTQKLENAKTAKNLKQWNDLAIQQEKNITEQLNDPTLDELDKITLQQQLDKLYADAHKYAEYGGFKKPKKAKKPGYATPKTNAKSVKAKTKVINLPTVNLKASLPSRRARKVKLNVR